MPQKRISISDDEIKAISSNIAFQLEQMLNFPAITEKNASQIFGKKYSRMGQVKFVEAFKEFEVVLSA